MLHGARMSGLSGVYLRALLTRYGDNLHIQLAEYFARLC